MELKTKKNAVKNSKKQKGKKRKHVEVEQIPEDELPPLPETRNSDEPVEKKTKWINKQRVLVMCARGINFRDRHLMKDLKTVMPHHREESKMERWKTLSIINEMCEMKHCNKAMLFEGRRKRDLYMWLSNIKEGPSVKFLVENVHTMGELKMTGNCLRGSRAILSFDQEFAKQPHLTLIKELLTQIFGVPYHHPKSQPFVDRVITFTVVDSRIWFRQFQILSEDGGLAEIGPRFVMNPVKIFEGSFTGSPIWENGDYMSPARHRQMLKKAAEEKYLSRTQRKVKKEITKPKLTHEFDKFDEVFKGDVEEKAKELIEKDENEVVQVEEQKKLATKHKLMSKSMEMKKLKKLASKQKPKSRIGKKGKIIKIKKKTTKKVNIGE